MNCSPDFDRNTPFVDALMHEIISRLADLASNGEEGLIDLRGLPMLDQDKKQLEELLGRGEVSAIVNAMGETQIRETAYAGVWWLRHKGAGDKIICEQIAITIIPELLKTHKADVEASCKRLQSIFNGQGEREDGEFS